MILIEENELIHVDSCDDVLEHFGVKGMKWGQRAARKVGSYGKEYMKLTYNSYRHPKSFVKSGFSSLRKGKLIRTHKNLKYRNKFIKDDIENRKNYKDKNREDRITYKNVEKNIRSDKNASAQVRANASMLNRQVYKESKARNKAEYKKMKAQRGSGIY